MINTWNETSLHKTLKEEFARKHKGKTEVKTGPYICDIETNDGTIIEIQTGNLSSLTEKLKALLLEERKVMLVYPLAEKTYIKTIDTDGTLRSIRKSPKGKNIYSIFEEIFKLYQLFEYENFSLKVILVEVIKTKELTEDPIQTLQKNRRFKKNYLYTDKELKCINGEIDFSTTKDFKKIIPDEIPEIFSTRELKKTQVKNSANQMLWVLSRMQIIEKDHKEGNLVYYKIKKQ